MSVSPERLQRSNATSAQTATERRSRSGDRPPGRGRRRDEILDAAIRVFARRGYHGARISDIAREAGSAYGLVYHYFKNKDEILDTIFREQWQAFLDLVESIAAGSGTVEEKLRALATLVLFAYRRRPDWVKVLVFEVQRSPRFAEPEPVRAVGRLFQSVAQILSSGVESGELRPRVDADVAAIAFIGALETMITEQVLGLMRRPPGDPAADGERVDAVVDLFIRGMGAGRSA